MGMGRRAVPRGGLFMTQEPYIGCWISWCCEEDLRQIENAEQLRELTDLLQNFRERGEDDSPMIFASKEDALSHLAKW